MRRPDSVVGLTLHLVRQRYGAAAPRRAALVVGAVALGVAAFVARRPAAPPAPRHRVAHLWTVGQCAASQQVCVADSMCGAGDRCVDPLHLDARIQQRVDAHDESVNVFPHVVADGEGYGVAWASITDETSDIWFARLDANGRRKGAAVQLTRGGSVRLRPRVARGPAGWAVGWLDVGEDGVASYVQRLDGEGRAQGTATRVGSGEFVILSEVVANGAQYGGAFLAASASNQMTVNLVRFTQDGTAVGAPVTVAANQLVLGTVGLTTVGQGWFVGWNHFVPRDERAETYVAMVAGERAAAPVRLDAHAGRNGSTALDFGPGAGIGAVWEDQFEEVDDDSLRNGLAFGGLSNPTTAIPRKAVTDRRAMVFQPSLAGAGEQHGLVFTRLEDDLPTVQFGRLDARGTVVGSIGQLNSRTSLAVLGSLAWNGRNYAAAWTQIDRDGVSLRLVRLDAQGRRIGSDLPISSR